MVLVFPGGDHESYRSTFVQNVIDFNGRKGYVRTAVECGVPIVPAVSIGAQETQLFLTRGAWLARQLRLHRIRMDILPLTVGFPFGLTSTIPANFPLPSKIVTELLEPIHVADHFGDDPGRRRGRRSRARRDAERAGPVGAPAAVPRVGLAAR